MVRPQRNRWAFVAGIVAVAVLSLVLVSDMALRTLVSARVEQVLSQRGVSGAKVSLKGGSVGLQILDKEMDAMTVSLHKASVNGHTVSLDATLTAVDYAGGLIAGELVARGTTDVDSLLNTGSTNPLPGFRWSIAHDALSATGQVDFGGSAHTVVCAARLEVDQGKLYVHLTDAVVDGSQASDVGAAVGGSVVRPVVMDWLPDGLIVTSASVSGDAIALATAGQDVDLSSLTG